MGDGYFEELDMEVLPSMWPDDLGDEARKQFNMEKPRLDRDMLKDVKIEEDPSVVDFKRLVELTNYSDKGSSQLAYLVKHWEHKQANIVRLLDEELSNLDKQRHEAELKKLEILEEYRFEEENLVGDKRPISILNDVLDVWGTVPRRSDDVLKYNKKIEIDAEYDSIKFWKQRAVHLDKMLEASIQREQELMQKMQENIKNLETQSSPVEELSQILERADNFLHFILQNAPVVIGHQDNELRYRFIYNHFPRLDEEDIIGKTDTEIFSGAGVKEIQEFKKDVLDRGLSAKREITFETPLFGLKTFLIYVEPVFSKAGETIGINYMGMDVTDQVSKREKITKLREEIAVQKAKETELNKTIHITEETMRAKQMLATMSHEIRSPLAGVVSMAEILANTKLEKEQRQLLDVMLSSGDLVLQLINDILDLSKVESGVMKLEAVKFRPREVVKHVLQTAAASLQKELTLEGHVADDIPVEVIGDVLRIRQILTNLISNSIKFTHEGKVGISLHVISEQYPRDEDDKGQVTAENAVLQPARISDEKAAEPFLTSLEDLEQHDTPVEKAYLTDEDDENNHQPYEKIVLLRCDVYDTGIGIPEKALPSLFKKYMQVSADHARKYGGTGLGLAICKQLVELMGGRLTVTSQVNCGSTFSFVLPCKVSLKQEDSDDPTDVLGVHNIKAINDASAEENNGSFLFKPHRLGALFPSSGYTVRKIKHFGSNIINAVDTQNGLPVKSDPFSSLDFIVREKTSVPGVFSIPNCTDTVMGYEALQHNPEHDLHDTGTVNRIDKEQQEDSGCLMNETKNAKTNFNRNPSITSSESCMMTCTKVTTLDKNSLCKLTCSSPSDENFQSTSDDMSELSKIGMRPKILLVEDSKINVMVAQSMMKQLGHSIDVVNNGLEAIRAVQRSHYDLILMDVCMPIMDGLQATRLIRSFEEHGYWDESIRDEIDHGTTCSNSPLSGPGVGKCRGRIPIIAMTANALSESADDCLGNGMDSFVSKPVTFQKLKQCLQQYLSC